jgi:LAO/AO transport system kinase
MLQQRLSVSAYIDGITAGKIGILSKAISVVESQRPEDRDLGLSIVEGCLALQRSSRRIGLTGLPGAGKSTFIDQFGLHLVQSGHQLAILSIDPTSPKSKGSILGDKTRMYELSQSPNVFIRPSPSGLHLGGVNAHTRHTIILCEAAGFDTIIVETVGVGQSETAVSSMVDCLIVLLLAGGGDELQGMKRGIMEFIDMIFITKADGQNTIASQNAARDYQNALSLFMPYTPGWKVPVIPCSALSHAGFEIIDQAIMAFFDYIGTNELLHRRRQFQDVEWFEQLFEQAVWRKLAAYPALMEEKQRCKQEIAENKLLPLRAVDRLTAQWLNFAKLSNDNLYP